MKGNATTDTEDEYTREECALYAATLRKRVQCKDYELNRNDIDEYGCI